MEPAQFSRREILKNDLTSIFSRYWPAALSLAAALPAAYAQKAGQPPAVPGSGGYAPAAILVLLLLLLEGYAIRRETLAKDGKFIYPVMEVVYAPGETLTDGEYYITPALRRSGSELLPAFRESVLSGLRKTVEGLSGGDEEKYRHYKAILEELTDDDCS